MDAIDYPKVYILLEPFNNRTGMGVTMTNLFKNWPKERISIAAECLDIELCEKIRPCASYLQLSAPAVPQLSPKTGRMDLKYRFLKTAKRIASYVYSKCGGSDLRKRTVSEELKNAIETFNPDIIFTALGSLDRIRFAEDICKVYPKAKLAVYIVDDWPNTKQNERWLPAVWKRKYDKALKRLLSRTDIRLSICRKMSETYRVQYLCDFLPFHNPVDMEAWQQVKAVSRYGGDVFSIVYVGKINRDTKDNIINLATAVSELNYEGHRIIFEVYTPSRHNIDVTGFNGFSIMESVPNADIPALLKSYDALFLTLGFSKISRAYTRLSMPTKLTEYLASGVPIILNAPQEIAVTEYCQETDTALICNDNSTGKLKHCIKELYTNSNLRARLSESALNLARHHDIKIIREQFRHALQ